MKVPTIPEDLHLVKDESTRRFFNSMWTKLVRSINGRIDFGSPQGQSKGAVGNIDGTWPGTLAGGYMITTPGVANTQFTVTHNLGRIPVGYDVRSIDAAAHVYDSNKAGWTKTTMLLKCDVATVHLVLFVH
jgi:hypothetical protein